MLLPYYFWQRLERSFACEGSIEMKREFSIKNNHCGLDQRSVGCHRPNIALQLTPTASLLVPCASLRRR